MGYYSFMLSCSPVAKILSVLLGFPEGNWVTGTCALASPFAVLQLDKSLLKVISLKQRLVSSSFLIGH